MRGLAILATGSLCRAESELDKRLSLDNAERKVDVAPVVGDLNFLRRTTIDLIGRIPTMEEVKQYGAWPKAERREKLVDKLLAEGFGDRWTVFMADLLRIRSNRRGRRHAGFRASRRARRHALRSSSAGN